MNEKKLIRKRFRDSVFKRDGYRCIACGYKSNVENAEEELDAHHIKNRNCFKNGGYVAENGASLCKFAHPSCHEKAEEWLNNGSGEVGYSPEELYNKISSSFEKAVAADGRLGSTLPLS